jgi:hypothetical protein
MGLDAPKSILETEKNPKNSLLGKYLKKKKKTKKNQKTQKTPKKTTGLGFLKKKPGFF